MKKYNIIICFLVVFQSQISHAMERTTIVQGFIATAIGAGIIYVIFKNFFTESSCAKDFSTSDLLSELYDNLEKTNKSDQKSYERSKMKCLNCIQKEQIDVTSRIESLEATVDPSGRITYYGQFFARTLINFALMKQDVSFLQELLKHCTPDDLNQIVIQALLKCGADPKIQTNAGRLIAEDELKGITMQCDGI